MRTSFMTWSSLILLSLCGCPNGGGDDGADDVANDEGGDECEPAMEGMFVDHDESGCGPAATDYQPLGDAAGDPYPACISDDGVYHLVDSSPSSIARIEAFESIMDVLGPEATPEDFTMARTIYAADEGLESRLVRREDLHYPEIPMSDWVEGVDADKQCTAEANVTKHPDRCVGPAQMAPMLNEAFAQGQAGDDDPAVLTARIEATLMWFMHVSVFKEANTCLTAPKDCDSSWAYYTGGNDRSGGIGYAGRLRGLSALGHDRIFDGVLAARCWRDLYPIEEYATIDDVPAEGQALLDDAYAQLDLALQYGWSRVVRDRLVQQDAVCGSEADANWAFLQIAGPVLDDEAARRDPAQAATLAALWTGDTPSAAELEAAVAALDATFPCP